MQLTGSHSYRSTRPTAQKAPVRFGVAAESLAYEVEARDEYRRTSNNPSATSREKEIARENLQWAESSSRTTEKVLEKTKVIKDGAKFFGATFANAVEQCVKLVAVTADNIRHVVTHPEVKRSFQKGFNTKPW